MYIQLLTSTDDEPNQLVGTITLRDGKLIIDTPEGALHNIVDQEWPVHIIDEPGTRMIHPQQEPELFLEYAHRIFKNPYFRATKVRED